jgi:hypothetical protein
MPRRAILLMLMIFNLAASAQNTSFLSQAADKMTAQPVEEKAYLHLDRSYYVPGDTIWFKAYVAVGPTHSLSAISNVLNVGLANSRDSIVQMIKIPLISGLGWSDIPLPDTLPSGQYRIIAYTNWMRNAGPDYFFEKPIQIHNPFQGPVTAAIPHHRKSAAMPKPADKADIQFFPESGSLVNGIRSKVAFKATGGNGLGLDATGIVTDDSGQQITMFKSEHLGMGIFYLTPETGKTYKASVTFADGAQCVIGLPAAVDKGFVMNINNSDSSTIRLTVTASKSVLNDSLQYGEINLVAQAGGKIYYTARSKVTAAPLAAVIPKSKFPSGIVQFTLFSARCEPLNERIAFIQRHDQLSLNLSADKTVSYTSREKVKIDLNAVAGGKPAIGSFSVAVINESVLPDDTDATIFTHLLLTSDLKGYIEKPGYYFSNNQNAASDLDVLMLTQGYRRFEWKKILKGETAPARYQPEKTLTLSGYVKTPGGKPVAKAKVSLLSTQGGYMLLDTVTNQDGRFVFDKLMIVDSLRCKIQAHTPKNGKNVVITIDDTLPHLQHYAMTLTNDSISAIRLPAKKIPGAQPAKIPANGHSKLLKEVVIKAQKPLLENSSNLNGPGNADEVLLMKNIHSGCATIADCLVGRLNFVTVGFDEWGVGSFSSRIGTMAIYVDGVLTKPNLLFQLSPQTIESIEVLLPGGLSAVYGPEAHAGAILINTKKGGYSSPETNVSSYTIKSYHKAAVFYSPKYDYPNTYGKPDNRITIYWNPNIITDKDGKASFEYYNADTKGTYRICVEGIDENGRIGRQVYRYSVE